MSNRRGRPKNASNPLVPHGGALKIARDTVSLSQAEAAFLAGVSPRTWQRWEAGEIAPKLRNWLQFMRVTGQLTPVGHRESPTWQELLQSRARAMLTQEAAAALIEAPLDDWRAWESGHQPMPPNLWTKWLETVDHDG